MQSPASAVVRQQASGSDLVATCLYYSRAHQELLACKEPANYKHPRQALVKGIWRKKLYVAIAAVFNVQDAYIRCARMSNDAVVAPSQSILRAAQEVEL
ncbi:hypothetical protein KC359_g128 [Hortaea werneckii]|nr:hypothetical protein KC359_g128 [Hortaea werneckii]